ncbi:MAG: alpha/beta hydrolase [Pseudomonadota bacterium]
MRTPALAAMLAALTPIAACAGPISSRIYPAPTVPLTLAGLPAGAKLITVTTADKLALHGVAIAPQPGRPTLLIFHGNGASAASTVKWFAPLIALGYGVIAAEYRGYSANPGKPSEPGLAADADAFYALAKARAGAAPVWVVGHSLGGGVAFGLARRHTLAKLITIGTFSRLKAMVPKLARAFVSDEYDNLDAIPTLDEPLYLIHGTADDVIPATEGNALYRAAQAARHAGGAYVVAGARHNPDGAALAAIVTAIERGSPATLPATIKAYPF